MDATAATSDSINWSKFKNIKPGPDFLYDKHVNYLLKALERTPPGIPLNVAEAHRLSSLFFIVSGLDLLGALDTNLSEDDKQTIVEWIYAHQVDNCVTNNDHLPTPTKTTILTDNSSQQHKSNTNHIYTKYDYPENIVEFVKFEGHCGFRATSVISSDIPIDCGNISMTYCALATLCVLGDKLTRVNRSSIITSLKYLQQSDGSFRPSILGGECDMRLVYCAISVSAILNDWSGIDKDKCAKFIKTSLSYEGAFGQCPGAEAHGGSTYCAVASLKLMSKFEDTLNEDEIRRLVRWCLNRLDEGFSGRPNKDQDTCYTFWIGACLVMLNHFDCIEQDSLLNFVLLAQEERGGLSKVPAFYSDPLHTYLGLAGLSFIDEHLRLKKEVKLASLDPMLNISSRAREHLRQLQETDLAVPI